MNKRLNNKGFTLIELLATITVLAIVMSLSAYIMTNVIGKAKAKSYLVNKNEVESNANSYAMENSDKLYYVDGGTELDSEHQCVTVQNLIDMGYLKDNITNSKIKEDEYVSKDACIYLERNSKTKTILKSEYNYGECSSLCNIAMNVKGDIRFESNPSLDTWSKSKTITISYSVRYGNINDYTTSYEYDRAYTSVSESIPKRVIKVTETGTLTGKIEGNANGQAVNEIRSIKVTKIDNINPTVQGTSTAGTYTTKATITLHIRDNTGGADINSGVDVSTIDKTDFIIKIGTYTVSASSLTLTKKNNDIHDLQYELVINDSINNGTVTMSVPANSIKDIAGNGNEAYNVTTGIIFKNTFKVTFNVNGGDVWNNTTCTSPSTLDGTTCSKTVRYNTNYGDLPTATRSGYSFDGWYTEANNGTKVTSSSVFTRTSDQTLYAHWNAVAKDITITYKFKSASIRAYTFCLTDDCQRNNNSNNALTQTCTAGVACQLRSFNYINDADIWGTNGCGQNFNYFEYEDENGVKQKYYNDGSNKTLYQDTLMQAIYTNYSCDSPPSSSSGCDTPINDYRCNTCTGSREYVSCCDTNTMMCGSTAWNCYANDGNAACNGSSSSPSSNTTYSCYEYICQSSCVDAVAVNIGHLAQADACWAGCETQSNENKCIFNPVTEVYNCIEYTCDPGKILSGTKCCTYSESQGSNTGLTTDYTNSSQYSNCNAASVGKKRWQCWKEN